MTNDECRAEALKRVEESDRLLDNLALECAKLSEALDEAEKLAKAATPGPWSADPTGTVCADADLQPDGNGGEILPSDGPMEIAECYRNERAGERGHNAAHIARWDPSTVLRLVERDRRLLEEIDSALADDWADEAADERLELIAAFWLGTQEADR